MDAHPLHGGDGPDALRALFERQRQASRCGEAIGHAQRVAALDSLLDGIFDHEEALVEAANADFGTRSARETRLLELFPLVDEIRHARRHLRRWMRPRAVPVNWQFWPSRARIVHQPLGVVAVIGAWNYPILLTLSPLVGALAAGNRVIVKPSELAPATAEVIRGMIAQRFAPDHVHVATGGADVAAALAALPLDHLLFTGSSRVGSLVMQAAAANLTPVTLELGGKSPALVHDAYPIALAADRICRAKFWNAGQTCVAPDHVLVPQDKVGAFLEAAERAIASSYPRWLAGPDYTGMISRSAWRRMQELVEDARAKGALVRQVGPAHACPDAAGRAFAPTLVAGASDAMRLIREEIFGPILPVLAYASLDDAIARINARPRPLALYYFDTDRGRIEHVLRHTVAGGVTVNDCIFHLPQHALPFGGVGPSGMGAYHGAFGFATFSKRTGVLVQHPLVGAMLGRLAAPPYGAWSDRLIDFLLARGRRGPGRRPRRRRDEA